MDRSISQDARLRPSSSTERSPETGFRPVALPALAAALRAGRMPRHEVKANGAAMSRKEALQS